MICGGRLVLRTGPRHQHQHADDQHRQGDRRAHQQTPRPQRRRPGRHLGRRRRGRAGAVLGAHVCPFYRSREHTRVPPSPLRGTRSRGGHAAREVGGTTSRAEARSSGAEPVINWARWSRKWSRTCWAGPVMNGHPWSPTSARLRSGTAGSGACGHPQPSGSASSDCTAAASSPLGDRQLQPC